MKDKNNRETWLLKAINILKKDTFAERGYAVPALRVSVGLPYGRGSKKAIGQHFHPKASSDGLGSIFISPTIDDTHEVLATLVHEMVHGVVGNEAKHGALFRKCAEAVGLEGKMTATNANSELVSYFKKTLVKKIGTYPHARLNLAEGRPTKKQTTRMVKMMCVEHDYKCRASLTTILEHGTVICPVCDSPMEVELPDEE